VALFGCIEFCYRTLHATRWWIYCWWL